MICLLCRDKGTLGGCPSCGKSISLERPAVEVPEETLQDLSIPEYYFKNRWSKQILLDSHKDIEASSALEHYAENLSRIHSIFCRGQIPNKSFIVIAQQGMSKMTWAYSCMQEALSHGFSVVPILDNTQYKRLSIISSDRMSSKIAKQSYSIEDYNTADVCFLTVDPDNFQGSYRTIESLLSKRARLGKQTFILSRFSLTQMALLDYTNSFATTTSTGALKDKNKYLEVIGG